LGGVATLVAAFAVANVDAGDAFVGARAGLELAAHAADAWADDARLVWLENDAPLDANGRAPAWGYLYYSAEKHAMRSWSVRDGGITTAQDHTVSAEAPALQLDWADSDRAAARAWEGGGREFCGTTGSLESLVLVHGIFAPRSTWVAVFAAGDGPRLHVVLDAKDGDVVKRWRG
jgi:predicted RecA/RadA family phage recombinase